MELSIHNQGGFFHECTPVHRRPTERSPCYALPTGCPNQWSQKPCSPTSTQLSPMSLAIETRYRLETHPSLDAAWYNSAGTVLNIPSAPSTLPAVQKTRSSRYNTVTSLTKPARHSPQGIHPGRRLLLFRIYHHATHSNKTTKSQSRIQNRKPQSN